MIQPNRRGLILGLSAALVAAPAIVRAGSLMPIKASLVVPQDGIALRSIVHPTVVADYIEKITITGYNIYGTFITEEVELQPSKLGLRVPPQPSFKYITSIRTVG